MQNKIKPTLSLLLILCILTISVPASPQIVVGSFVNLKQSIVIASATSNWYERLTQGISNLFSAKNGLSQEAQEFRDSEVVRIGTDFPEAVPVGGQIHLEAVPFDANNIPVSGVRLDWEVETPKGEIQLNLSGLFALETIGTYKVTVRGAGKEKTSVISVVEPTIESSKVDSSKDTQSQENLLPYEDWNPTSIETYGRLPRNQRGETPGIPKENSNFNIVAPVLSVAGRAGLDVNLNLTYNSRVWTKMGQDISYDIDKDTPAPGWSLGFGKIINFGGDKIVQFEGNGSKRFFAGSVKTESSRKIIEGQSTDGSFVKVRAVSSSSYVSGQYYWASAGVSLKYPDGTTVSYGGWNNPSGLLFNEAITMIPYEITDKHGNSITIAYYSGSDANGRTINYIKDTLGRIYTFNYTQINSIYYLTSVTGPGLRDENNQPTVRTFVQLNYKDHTLATNFSGLNPKVRDDNTNIKVLSAIYYPATNTGYWFGADPNASDNLTFYSPYGMIRKIEEQKGMSFDTATGKISAGQVTRRRTYGYPENTTTPPTDVPTYSTVTETWDGMPNPSTPAETQYFVDWTSNPRTTTVILPYDQGTTKEYSFNDSTSPKDGMTFKTEYYDKNNVLRSKDETDWGTATLSFSAHNNFASYNLATVRPNSITHTEIDNGVSLSKKSVYDSYGSYNRVLQMHEVGYNNETLRTTKTQYTDKNDALLVENDWYKPRVINLPTVVDVSDGSGNRVNYTEYRYDIASIYNLSAPLPPNFVGNRCPQYPYACAADFSEDRGNLSNVVKYSKVTNSTLEGQIVTDGRIYDAAGNITSYNPSSVGINQTYSTFTSATGYAYPEVTAQGMSGYPNALVSTTVTYDYNTGLPLTVTDANQKTTTFKYDLQTWRLKKTISPTGAYTINDFDDLNLIYTQTDYTSGGQRIGKQINKLNGLSLPYRQESLSGTDGQAVEIYDVTETLYDNLGRAEKKSNPFRSNENTNGVYWSQVFYDELGRVKRTKSADGSEKFNYYSETSRPNVASNGFGHTFRIKDPVGKEKWYRTDSDGNIVEVVEPKPDGDGLVGTDGFLTKYFYDSLGQLTRTEQGAQERKFRYDSMGRLTNQKMAETKATLNDDGDFVGETSGQWSDSFTYDAMSNIATSTDARGVKTKYSHVNPATGSYLPMDSLNRLFSISYETTGTTGVLPSPTVKFEYQPSGNVAQVKSVYSEKLINGNAERVVTKDFLYDGFGRVEKSTTTLANRSGYPMTTEYSYDSLSRIVNTTYPKQFGMIDPATGNPPQKIIHNDYDSVGRMSALKVNNVDYASNFTFNNFDQVTSVKIGPSGANQITEQYDNDPQSGKLLNQKVLRGSTALLDLSYQYQQCSCSTGGSGQITAIFNNLDRNKDRTYDYDKLSRLTKVTGGLNQTWSQGYEYDRYGNRKTVQSLGFEALRMNEQSKNNKSEQNKAVEGIIPQSSLMTKEKLLENVKNLTKIEKSADQKETSPDTNTNPEKTGKSQKTSEQDQQTSNLTTPGTPFDFDGDGKADFSTWRRTGGAVAAGTWSVFNRQTGLNDTLQLGAAGNQIAPGDYDGDGKTDKAIWNTETADWTIKHSSNGTTYAVHFGAKGDAIVPADYDGDGKTDIAVWRPSDGVWWILKSSDGSYYSTNFGSQQYGDIPIVGDYDGDGKADISVWRPSQGDWYIYILQSSNGQVLQPHWGLVGDVPAPADYDGDGKTDLAIWRPSAGVWYVLKSSTGQYFTVSLGSDLTRDVLVPADYDGDDKADQAIWTPSTGTWSVMQSTTGTIVTHQLGTRDDVAVPSAYIRRSSAPRGQSVEIPRDGYENLTFEAASNRITTTGFEYDFAGNQTQVTKPDGTVQKFQYDAAGRMVKVKDVNDQTLVTYTYGISRERIVTQEGNESSVNITYYAWEGSSVISEYAESASNALLWTKNYIYLTGSLLATQDKTVAGENLQFAHSDKLGTRLVTNPTDGTSFEQSTLPFGTALDSESTGSLNRRFTSYDRSESTKLDYANNRFYDSAQGRFTTVDPIGRSASKIINPQTLNLYAYTANDPVNRADPSGLDWGSNTIAVYSPTYRFPTMGGTGTSQQTWWGNLLTGILGNLLGGGRSYAGYIGPMTYSVQSILTNTARIMPIQPPPLPGSGTFQNISIPNQMSNSFQTKLPCPPSIDKLTDKNFYQDPYFLDKLIIRSLFMAKRNNGERTIKPDQYIEHGGWILMDRTGKRFYYLVKPTDEEDSTLGVDLNHPNKYLLPYLKKGWLIIAEFHTHPTSGLNSVSPEDEKLANARQIPGFVIDFDKKMYSYGPNSGTWGLGVPKDCK